MFILPSEQIETNSLALNDDEVVYIRRKQRGVYIQIHKMGDEVQMYTSSGQVFCNATLASNIIDNICEEEVILECDYVHVNETKSQVELKAMLEDDSFIPAGYLCIFNKMDDKMFSERLQPYFSRTNDSDNAFRVALIMNEKSYIFREVYSKFTFGYSKSIHDRYVTDAFNGVVMQLPTQINKV